MEDMPEEDVRHIFTRMELSSRAADHELVCKMRFMKLLTDDEDKKRYIQDEIDKFLKEQEESYYYTKKPTACDLNKEDETGPSRGLHLSAV